MLRNRGRGIARVVLSAGLSCALALGGVPGMATLAWADNTPGNLTVDKAERQKGDVTYEAYRLFEGDVTSGKDGEEALSNIKWATGAKDVVEAAIKAYVEAGHAAYSGTTAQDAADYLKANLMGTGDAKVASSDSLAELLAERLAASELKPVAELTAGKTASLDDGYYLLVTKDTSLGNGAAGTSPIYTLAGGEDVIITEKVTPPTITKEVQEDSTGNWGRYADANYNQEVSYRLTATLPSNLVSFDTYHLEFVDYLSKGLSCDRDSVEVYVVHSDESEEDVTGSFTISYPNGGGVSQTTVYNEGQSVLTANCDDIKTLELKTVLSNTDKIEVRYKARLDSDSVMGVEGNPNQAKLVYSNNPTVSGDGETELVDPTVFTYQLNLHKLDRDAGAQGSLAGAKFTIQLTEADGDKDKASKEKYLQANGDLGSTAYEFTTDEDGNITVPRIDAGTYVIHEMEAPTGYLKTADVTVKITSTMPEGNDGKLTLAAEVGGNADAELTSDPNSTTGVVGVTIKDVKNVGMPQTGSAGFAALMVGGGSMVVLSLAVILRRSRSRDLQR